MELREACAGGREEGERGGEGEGKAMLICLLLVRWLHTSAHPLLRGARIDAYVGLYS